MSNIRASESRIKTDIDILFESKCNVSVCQVSDVKLKKKIEINTFSIKNKAELKERLAHEFLTTVLCPEFFFYLSVLT